MWFQIISLFLIQVFRRSKIQNYPTKIKVYVTVFQLIKIKSNVGVVVLYRYTINCLAS